MQREVHWERMFPDELEAAFDNCPAVYFTYGLCEPHGPQNTVGLDALKAHAIACRLTGHYGPNWQDLKTLLEVLQPNFAMRLFGLPDFEANHIGFSNQGDGADHAGRVETSLLWALEPDCVDMSRMPDKDETGPHFAMGGNAYDSDRRIGERMVNDEVTWLGDKMKELLEDYAQLNISDRQPVTFREVEQIWNEQVKPVLKTFETMKNRGEPPPEDSQWFRQ